MTYDGVREAFGEREEDTLLEPEDYCMLMGISHDGKVPTGESASRARDLDIIRRSVELADVTHDSRAVARIPVGGTRQGR